MSNLPEHDPKLTNQAQGVYRKFDVRRTDGSDQPGGKHHGCEYFVLDVTHDPHAIAALTAYALACEKTHPLLAADLRDRYGLNVQPKALANEAMNIWLTAVGDLFIAMGRPELPGDTPVENVAAIINEAAQRLRA